ncbi:MAG TPA: ABC transporter permease [Hyphomonadaceae bacterium]|nr:ABC transporter permease [Hyphomonadaceae bacterium]
MTSTIAETAPAEVVAASGDPGMRGRTSDRVIHIRPSRGLLDLGLDQVWSYRHLLFTLVRRDVSVQYKQAALGAGWAVIQPIFAVIIFTIIFSLFAKLPIPGNIPYPIFAFAAVLPWNYFADSVRRASTSLVQEEELVKKVFFPRLVLPLSGVLTPIIDFLIGLCVLVIMMAFFGIWPSWRFIAIPFLIAFAGMTALTVSLWLAPINVRYRDVRHTLPFLLQIWMYGSPVVYSSTIVPEAWKWVFAVNPMVGVIDGFRWVIFGSEVLTLNSLAIGALIVAPLLFGGLVFFRKLERTFPDVI